MKITVDESKEGLLSPAKYPRNGRKFADFPNCKFLLVNLNTNALIITWSLPQMKIKCAMTLQKCYAAGMTHLLNHANSIRYKATVLYNVADMINDAFKG